MTGIGIAQAQLGVHQSEILNLLEATQSQVEEIGRNRTERELLLREIATCARQVIAFPESEANRRELATLLATWEAAENSPAQAS